MLGLGEVDEDELYAALDLLGRSRTGVEKVLAQRTGFGHRIDGDDRMVHAPCLLAFKAGCVVDGDRFRAGGGLFVAPPDRRIPPCPYLLHEPDFEKLGDGPLGRAALGTRWRNQAMITGL